VYEVCGQECANSIHLAFDLVCCNLIMAMPSLFSPDIFIKYITKSYVLLFLFFTIILTLQFSCSVGNVSSGSGLVNVDVIVLDEVHYLSDISRGTVWEEIVSMIYCLCT